MTSSSLAVGVDAGGSSIKFALVDLGSGELAGERFSTPTPAQDSIEALLAALVLCGGITKEQEKFMSKLRCEARLCVGTLRSEAGIVGAALATQLPAAVDMR